jgi:AraC-like DNA-binding protein
VAALQGRAEPAGARSGPDPLSEVLRTVQLTGALFFLVDASVPWGVDVPPAASFSAILLPRAQHVVSYHIVLEGSGWIGLPGAPPVRFRAGDILVVPHGDPYAMLSAPGQPPEFDAEATLAFFRDMAAGRLPFAVTEGGGGAERTRYVCGYLGCDLRPFNPVLATLPRLLRVTRPLAGPGDLLDRLIEVTLAEARAPRAGSECVRLRLSELLFVEVMRRHLQTLPAGQTGWLAGLRDPSIGAVLSLLHQRPAHPWSLVELARSAGLSRAVLAERFAQLVGCPPMQYLLQWRMQLAARALADRRTKVSAVAGDVGYSSEAAFSRAFRRVTGLPPAEWRRRHAGPGGLPRVAARRRLAGTGGRAGGQSPA